MEYCASINKDLDASTCKCKDKPTATPKATTTKKPGNGDPTSGKTPTPGGSSGGSNTKTPTTVLSCFKCGDKYYKATSKAVAASTAGVSADNCSEVSMSYCNGGGGGTPSSNPQTGSVAVVVAWLIGLSAIGYAVWYFKRMGSIE